MLKTRHKLAIFRYSSHSQREESIEGQLKVCYEFAQRNGYAVIGKYIDRALSGTTDNRPQFLKMVNDSAKKHFGGVLVYQLDRFARNRYDSAHIKPNSRKTVCMCFLQGKISLMMPAASLLRPA